MFNDVTKNLDILQEECAELISIISKIKRFGWDSYHPDDPSTDNVQRIIQEMGDVQALMSIMKGSGVGITQDKIDEAAERKVEKLKKFY